MLHVIQLGNGFGHRTEARIERDIADSLAIDPYFAIIAERFQILLAGSNHSLPSRMSSA
jgi:hypothetical protein